VCVSGLESPAAAQIRFIAMLTPWFLPRLSAPGTDEARSMLAGIYSWFTEGFDTADLKDARSRKRSQNRSLEARVRRSNLEAIIIVSDGG
jgi:hypothetical protein